MPVNDGSDYDYILDLKYFDTTKSRVDFPHFSAHGSNYYISIAKTAGKNYYGCFLHSVADSPADFPRTIHYHFVLVMKQDNRIIEIKDCERSFFKEHVGWGKENWIDPATIRDHIIKFKVWIDKSFSEIIESPASFDAYPVASLFDKMCSNFSFKVGEEVVYVLHGILTERCDYFQTMLSGLFKEGQGEMSVKSEIPIHGADVDVFKMIIEWLYTMDIQRLNGLSATLFVDLERLFVAADMYQTNDLCDAILKYLRSLLNQQTFGEIYGIAKRIANKPLENAVFLSWISESVEFNKSDEQINSLIESTQAKEHEAQDEDVEQDEMSERKEVTRVLEEATMYRVSRKIIEASSWDGDKESKLCVIKFLTSSLGPEEE